VIPLLVPFVPIVWG